MHTVCDLANGLWRQVVDMLGARTRFFQNLPAITSYLIFLSWQHLLETLAYTRPPPTAP